jgi:hypothetical protein
MNVGEEYAALLQYTFLAEGGPCFTTGSLALLSQGGGHRLSIKHSARGFPSSLNRKNGKINI